MATKLSVPKEYSSEDVEDRRGAPKESAAATDLRSEHAFDRAITEKTTAQVEKKFGAPYMEALGDSWVVRQEGRMRETAQQQMDAQARHDAARAQRRSKTAKEYKGVK